MRKTHEELTNDVFSEKMPYCYKNGKAEAIEVMMGRERGKGEKGGGTLTCEKNS